MANSQFVHANHTASGVRGAPQSGQKITSRAYAGNRPFLDEGKSQQSLNQKNAPLTIDQVRELLNKNQVALVWPRRVHYFVIGSCNRTKLWRY